ncbi:MAG TPA: lysyl oxidase family protein [Gaiellaceae bacterium]|nr:lysyl oxidase family protein [Gaiellaceae bacterium]
MIAIAATSVAMSGEPRAPRLLARAGANVVSIAADGTRRRLLAGADGATFSPDGTLVAFTRGGDLWVANADGTGQRRLDATPQTAESHPAWLGNRSLVYAARFQQQSRLRVYTLPTGPSRRIAEGPGDAWGPAVSPGGRLAFVSTRGGAPAVYVANGDGTNVQPFDVAPPAEPPLDVEDLAWSPDGRRLAYTQVAQDEAASVVVDDGTTRTPLATDAESPRRPVWSPDGSRLAFADASGSLRTAAADGGAPLERGPGVPLDWQVVPIGTVRWPNLVQRPPSGLLVMQRGRRWLLGFTSMVDNRGPGVLRVRANRPPHAKVMPARQLLEVAGGWTRVVEHAGELDFANAWPHFHWHLLAFDRYELRRAGTLRLLVRDHKEGFCLADHYGTAQGVPHGPPRFLASCEQHNPGARYVEEGSSVGYTDRYPGFYEGQDLDLTRLPAGRYWLVHRANPDFHLRELRYGDNVASLLLRLAWPGGHAAAPRISVLRTCRRERC